MSHSTLEPIVELSEKTSSGTSLGDLLEIARERLGPESVLEFDGELVVSMRCPDCGVESRILRRMARLSESVFGCSNCGGRREMELTHRIDGSEDYLSSTLAEIDVPDLDIVRARNGDKRVYYELTGDLERVLGFE
jgi:predicted RNA-binding Zn-ribbon protein involved in translation (DUF1610 family)